MKKGYKVTDVKREKKIGVAAENLEELIDKSCKKLGFNVSCAECRLCVAEDGTQVEDDEYLATLPSQTLFILLKNTEKMVTDFDYYYDLIRSQKKDYIDTGAAAKDFLTTNIKEKFKVFQKYIAAADDARTMLSERTQDPGWFEGLEPSEKTKEQSMSKRVKDRMRGYYYKTKSALQTSDVYIHSKNGRDTSFETARSADHNEMGMYEEHEAGSTGMRITASTPVTDNVLPPYNMSPPFIRSTKRLSTRSEDLEPAKKKPRHTESEKENNRTELENIRESQSSMLKQVKYLNDKLDSMKTLIDIKMIAMETKMTAMDTKMTVMDTKMTAMDTKMNAMDTKMNAMETDMNAMETKMTVMDTNMTAMDTNMTAMDTKMTAMDTKMAAMETNMTAMDTKMNAMNTKMAAMETNMTAMETNMTAMDTKMNAMNTKMAAMDTNMTAMDTKMTAMDTKMAAMETNMTAMDTKMNAMNTKMAAMETNRTAMDTKMNAMDTKMNAMETKMNAMQYESTCYGVEDDCYGRWRRKH